MRGISRRLAFIGIAAAVMLGAGAAWGAITITSPAPDGRIYACYGVKKGVLRVVNEGAACRRTERAISWQQAGLPGSQGVPGPQGLQGVTGPEGPPGGFDPTGIYRREDGASGADSAVAWCDAGDVALSGGYEIPAAPFAAVVVRDAYAGPDAQNRTGWSVRFTTRQPWILVSATCARG